MSRKDWNLLVLSAAQGQTLSPVQFQKALFLLGRKLSQEVGEGFYNFIPYNYGPFDAKVYKDAEQMEEQGLTYVGRSEGGWSVYGATPAGLERAQTLESDLPPRAAEYVHSVVRWVRSLSFNDLVRSIYQEFPEYRANSVFQG